VLIHQPNCNYRLLEHEGYVHSIVTDMRGMQWFGSMLGRGIINGFPVVVGFSYEVVGVDSGGRPY
jgi:hypothetical protein